MVLNSPEIYHPCMLLHQGYSWRNQESAIGGLFYDTRRLATFPDYSNFWW